jgi:glycerol kinase
MKKVEDKVENQITKEQLAKVQEQQKELNTLFRDIGFVETQKHILLHKQSDLNNSIEEYKAELEKEYGAITIDIETGVYTDVVKDTE